MPRMGGSIVALGIAMVTFLLIFGIGWSIVQTVAAGSQANATTSSAVVVASTDAFSLVAGFAPLIAVLVIGVVAVSLFGLFMPLRSREPVGGYRTTLDVSDEDEEEDVEEESAVCKPRHTLAREERREKIARMREDMDLEFETATECDLP